ncbi:MAG: hypothetical protein KAJ49_04770 [Arcobacteraceae bacterium]|nr:hypothetical protein [Arcobacteraceae bacterium]
MNIYNILENINKNLSLSHYTLDNLIFYVNKNRSSGMAMKALIQITTKLDDEKLDYIIDNQYNIHVLEK